MKLLSFLIAVATAIDNTMLMLMMNQNQASNPTQAGQMNMLIPFLLMQDDDDAKNATLSNKEMLLLMMMQGDSMGNTESILPLLFLGDDSDIDFKSFFLYSNMLKQDCTTSTDAQFQNLLPLLLLDSEEKSNSSSDALMLMLMMQSMGDSPIGINHMMPFLLLDDKEDSDSLLLMVMMNSMTGGMSSQSGFDNNFNMLLPLLINDCDDGDADCKKKQKHMMVLMMTMQSQAPATAMGPNMMLPLLLMDDEQNNEDLIFMLMVNQNREPVCEPTNQHHVAHYHEPARGSHGLRAPTVPRPAVNHPQPAVNHHRPAVNHQSSIRTYKIHPDGTRTEISGK